MNGPITNFELGRMQHREYEAEVSPYWGQAEARDDKPGLSKKTKLAFVLSGATLVALMAVQILAM